MALGDRIYINNNSTEEVLPSGSILDSSTLVVTLTTAYVNSLAYFTTDKTCSGFKVVNRGRDLVANPIELELPISVSTDTREEFTLDLNNLIYTFYSTTSGDVITWSWSATEDKVGN